MIVDSSAIVAILKREPEATSFRRLLEEADRVLVSVATVMECSIVVRAEGQSILDRFLETMGAVLHPIDLEQLRVARQAQLDFGRRSGSPAKLNFGDCFSYALAKTTGQPLLFKGDDFWHTDVTPAFTRR
jgi:ribonuclease VapC